MAYMVKRSLSYYQNYDQSNIHPLNSVIIEITWHLMAPVNVITFSQVQIPVISDDHAKTYHITWHLNSTAKYTVVCLSYSIICDPLIYVLI